MSRCSGLILEIYIKDSSLLLHLVRKIGWVGSYLSFVAGKTKILSLAEYISDVRTLMKLQN